MNLDDPRALIEGQLHSLVAKALEGHRSAEADRDLRAAGFDPDARSGQHLDPAAWRKVLELSAKILSPSLSAAAAQRALGERLVETARGTAWGKALLGLARLLGPRRALERMTQALGQHGATRLDERGPSELELWIRQPAISVGFTEGLLAASLKAVGADGLELSRRGNAKEGYTFEIAWDG